MYTHRVIFQDDGGKKQSGRDLINDYEETKETKKLDNLVTGSVRVLLDIRSIFPFDFFPDDLIIDEVKVSVFTKFFFWSKEVRSIEFKDIFNVSVQQGLFFAKLEIVDRYFSQQTIVVDFLTIKDAMKARRIIQGMIIAHKEDIDLQAIPVKKLNRKLERIGRSR